MKIERAIAAAFLALAVASASARAAEPATGELRGKVRVLKRGLLGGLSPTDDASGAIVYVTGFREPAPSALAELDQIDEKFVPRVLPIVAGQSVRFPNRDRVYHNVFSVSAVQPFDLGQYRDTDPPRTQSFDKPGLVPVFCNIHPQMISYVVVLENRAFALVAPDGSFNIRGVPAGHVTVNAWLPGSERVSRGIDVEPGAEIELEFELAQTNAVSPHLRKDGTPYPRPGYEAER